MDSSIAAGGQALVHQRVLGNIADNDSSVKDAPQLLGPPEKADNTQSAAPVEPAGDVVDIDPLAQTVADLRAIIDRLANASSGNDAKDVLSDLKNFVNDNTNSQFGGGILSGIGDIVDNVLDTLDSDPEALGNFVSFNFDFQFSQKSLQTSQTSLEATSLSFSFSLVTENTSFNADLNFSEKALQTPGAFKITSSESANISVVTNNVDLETNPALEGFLDIANNLLGSSSPFDKIFPDPVDAPPALGAPVEDGEAVAQEGEQHPGHPVLPNVMRERLADLQQSFDIGQRATDLLDELFSRINDARDSFAAASSEAVA